MDGVISGALVGFGVGLLSPFISTILGATGVAFLGKLGIGATIAIGSYQAGNSFYDGKIAQGVFRLGTSWLGALRFRKLPSRPRKSVNIGGEGEVHDVINLQPRTVLGDNWRSARDGKGLATLLFEGVEFLVYNAATKKLPFPSKSVPKIITNSVPVDTPDKGLFPSISSAEIKRVLEVGGQWIKDGVVVFTKM